MTTNDVECPNCSGDMWDNRATKRNPKQPDFKCKDKACDGVIWPPKGAKPAAAPSKAKQAYSAGPHIPEIDGPYTETGAPPPAEGQTVGDKLTKVFQVYDVCFDHAYSLAKRTLGETATHEGIAAQAATLFIQAAQRGVLP